MALRVLAGMYTGHRRLEALASKSGWEHGRGGGRAMATRTVAGLLVETLARAGVERIYGVSGDSLNGITDSIRRHERMRWIHVRHEETAAFAAGAEAHLTGRLAVCAGSCGPGNLHLINGLYDCHRSRFRNGPSQPGLREDGRGRWCPGADRRNSGSSSTDDDSSVRARWTRAPRGPRSPAGAGHAADDQPRADDRLQPLHAQSRAQRARRRTDRSGEDQSLPLASFCRETPESIRVLQATDDASPLAARGAGADGTSTVADEAWRRKRKARDTGRQAACGPRVVIETLGRAAEITRRAAGVRRRGAAGARRGRGGCWRGRRRRRRPRSAPGHGAGTASWPAD